MQDAAVRSGTAELGKPANPSDSVHQRKWGAILLAAVFLVCLGALDYTTGHNFALSAFYLIPISFGCWAGGRAAGLAFATLSAGIWLGADLLTVHPYPHRAIPYWNAFTLFVLFVVVVLLMSIVRSANQRLEETVQRRTAALQEEIAARQRLEQAKLQAERLAMVGTIAAQVAHEVRNPLGSITLNLDLLAREIEKMAGVSAHPAQEGRTLLHEMREEVRRIQRVIEDYLRFARLPKLQPKPLKLNAFLEQKLAFMAPAFRQAHVELQTEFDAAVKTISADAEQLWQAVLNLLQNSIEAMPSGGVLAVSTRRQERQTVLLVTDNGKGMSQEQIGQLFVPFFTTKPGGTGLGLPLTQRILNEHGAQIECASLLGKGTTFTIHLPIAPGT